MSEQNWKESEVQANVNGARRQVRSKHEGARLSLEQNES